MKWIRIISFICWLFVAFMAGEIHVRTEWNNYMKGKMLIDAPIGTSFFKYGNNHYICSKVRNEDAEGVSKALSETGEVKLSDSKF